MSTFLHLICQRGVIRSAAALTATFGLLAPLDTSAQDDPTVIGAGQRPYVLIVMDTSASMEFSSEGDQRYPCYDREIVLGNLTTCRDSELSSTSEKHPGVGSLFEWSPDAQLTTLGDPELIGPNLEAGASTNVASDDDDKHFPEDAIDMVGPCRVWAPPVACGSYERPPWYGSQNNLLAGSVDTYWRNQVDEMRGRYNGLTNSFVASQRPDRRLQDFNQSRHVQIKEILTGDMILRPFDTAGTNLLTGDWDPRDFGPGCFFVPRMYGTRIGKDSYKICAEEFTNASGRKELASLAGDNFSEFPDYDDPRPHLQEVYDYQLPTGLMDSLADTVIFGVATFDSFPGRYYMGSITHNKHDGIPDTSLTLPPNFGPESAVTQENDGTDKYNLGVYKIIGPKTLDVEGGLLRSISTFSQLAIADAGFLQETQAPNYTVNPTNAPNEFGVTFPSGLDSYLDPHYMGQLFISGATPLAAAVRDVHSYLVNGQSTFAPDGSAMGAPSNPIQDDDYNQCRAKHILLLTDGFPEPELDGSSAGFGALGSERLNPSFGYIDLDNDGNPNMTSGPLVRYPYSYTEAEVRAMRDDPALVNMDEKFQTRLHVVGLNTVRDGAETADIRRKLGRMALEGGTCALFYLLQSPEGRQLIPASMHPDGQCMPGDNCLVSQLTIADVSALAIPFAFPPIPNPELTYSQIAQCVAPALILERDDEFIDRTAMQDFADRDARDDLTKALQLIFNEVVNSSGGVSSRTRASITNAIDFGLERGQFRLFSGVEVSTKSLYWQGLLNRQPDICGAGTMPCADPNNPDDARLCVWPLHEEISKQVRTAGNPSGYVDNRRIFTSERLRDPMNTANGTIPDLLGTTDMETIAMFPTSGQLTKVTDNPDEFNGVGAGEAEYGQAAHGGQALRTRVPFRSGALRELENRKNGVDEMGFNFSFELLSGPLLSRIIGTSSPDEGRQTIWNLRGRDPEKEDNVLGAILNSNPVTVNPPSLDLPIESYQNFRDKFAFRPTMTFVATLDGLLHAIHTGERGDGDLQVRDFAGATDGFISQTTSDSLGAVRDGTTIAASTITQREAWAYAPAMLRTKYAQFLGRQPNLMDGTPVVQDVRLCSPKTEFNLNYSACGTPPPSGAGMGMDPPPPPPAEQWRTVLVQGLGNSGAGYFAMDVTRMGGALGDGSGARFPPDPVLLWEFEPEWEVAQIKKLQAAGLRARFAGEVATQTSNNTVADCAGFTADDPQTSDELPFMGLSVSEAAIANIALQVDPADADTLLSRPVAVFSAGRPEALEPYSGCAASQRSGHAIYVVDLQTGSLLRRFVEYSDVDGMGTQRFDVHLEGTPALYDGRPGSIASRGFVGDAAGRLFRINLSSVNPTDWSVQMMYDPCDDPQVRADATLALAPKSIDVDAQCTAGPASSPFGVASFPPEIALDERRRVVVIYGLGDRTDTSVANSAQAVVALQDEFERNMSGLGLLPKKRFAQVLEGGEKLTGRPVVFNSGVYFTSYKTDLLDACIPGTSRIWGLGFNPTIDMMGNVQVSGLFDPVTFNMTTVGADTLLGPTDAAGNHYWIGPIEPTLIRGLTIAFPKTCATFDPTGTGGLLEGADDPPPQLIATTGGSDPNSKFGQGANDGTTKDNITRFVVNLKRPTTQTVPLSWSLIAN